jgi:hypothetical protein
VKPPSPNRALTMPDGTTFVIVESDAESDAERIEFRNHDRVWRDGSTAPLPPSPGRELDGMEGELSIRVENDGRASRAGLHSKLPAPRPFSYFRGNA